ncbi:MAG TPA: DNA translocase FtsK [Syntrophomonadaceae bacterium]|nr:DNA translocase FtsK [Syntrophomonadaceae bacterium]
MPRKIKKRSTKQDGLKYEILGVALFALAIFIIVSFFKSTGIIGNLLISLLTFCIGKVGCLLFSLLLIYFACVNCWLRRPFLEGSRNIGVVLLFTAVLIILHLLLLPADVTRSDAIPILYQGGVEGKGGGFIGALLSIASIYLLARPGTIILTVALCIISMVMLTGVPFSQFIKKSGQFFVRAGSVLKTWLERILFVEEDSPETTVKIQPQRVEKRKEEPVIVDYNTQQEPEDAAEKESITEEPEMPLQTEEKVIASGNYVPPPLSILKKPMKIKSSRLNKELIENVRILEETLNNFGIKVCVSEVHKGPAITRYEIQPAPGVKVSRIMRLADDIALSLAAPAVRIEAPIPGKAAMGIEVPNREIATVCLREILETPEFQDAASKLSIALGKDIAGNPIVADLTKMPHLLIAGATGSGKSVCLNTIICSILYKANPNEVKLLLIDPKMVELITYNGIPHLLAPVVTEPKKAAGALRWVVKEMETRYELFSSLGVRDITKYNSQIKLQNPQEQALPYIVVVIDELSDLMMISPVDVEDAICRLAQMARAAGIHLVIATQRPSVDVITGVIKANIPSRIAFAVSSQIDSRTILDMNGAEKLLGRGDMLFMPVSAIKPIRIQGALVTEAEVEEIVKHLIKVGEPSYVSEFPVEQEEGEKEDDYGDELFYDAAKLVIEMRQASSSLLQRRLRIGYARAARLIDMLEAKGIVGPFEGSKPREVLMTPEQFYRYFEK